MNIKVKECEPTARVTYIQGSVKVDGEYYAYDYTPDDEFRIYQNGDEYQKFSPEEKDSILGDILGYYRGLDDQYITIER